MKTEIIHYAKREDGAQNLGVSLLKGAVHVLVTPANIDGQAAAERVAASVASASAEVERLEQRVAELQGSLERSQSARAVVAQALSAALLGKRRLFGQVLLKPERPGNWAGPVWLLDPQKQESAMGLRFTSLTEARQAFPELWPVGATEHGVLMDSVPLIP